MVMPSKAADYRVLQELVKPHIQSFDYFVEHGLQQAALGLKPVEITESTTRAKLRLWIDKPIISQPTKDEKDKSMSFDERLQPMECRQAGLTYQGHLTADVCFQWNDQTVMRYNTSFGRIPVMVMSSICHLRGLDPHQLVGLKEEASEVGGYFICNGHELVIRLLIVMKRNHALAVRRSSFRKRGPSFTEMGVIMRCVRRDQSFAFTRLHYLQHGSAAVAFLVQKQEYLIPVGIILKALSNTQDKEISDLLTSVYRKENESRRGSVGTHLISERALIILEETRQHGLHTRLQCLEYIGERFRPVLDGMETEPAAVVGEKVIEDYILVHLDNPLDKFNILIFMLQKLFALADQKAAPDNVDALQHQEILLPGHLLTLYVKDRMQQWLLKVKGTLLKEIEDKPNEVDLQDFKKVQKVLDKVSSTDIGKRVEYLLKTGNLVLHQGIDNLQTSGYTVAAERLNYLRYISHFRSVHRGSYFQNVRTTAVRKLLPESWGFLCPVHTPDGTPCGLLNHLTSFCQITSDLDSRGMLKNYLRIRKDITSVLSSLGMCVIPPRLLRAGPPEFLTVILDGRVIGQIPSVKISSAVTYLRHRKVLSNSDIPSDLEIAYVPCTFSGAYPGLFLFTTSARMIRPVKQLMNNMPGDKVIEMIGPMEQVYMEISCLHSGDGGKRNHSMAPTHSEIHPMAMLSIVAGLTPWSDHNQSPRNMYQCQMGKQTMGFPSQNIQFRSDHKLYRLQTPQTPISRTVPYLKYYMDEFPTGTNAVVAVISYTGYDMEDAMIINKASMERGLCHGQVYKIETIDLTKMRQKGDGIVNIFGQGEALSGSNFLDADGLPYIGQRLEADDPYCGIVNTMTRHVKLLKVRPSEIAVVDSVAAIRTGKKDPLQKVTIRLRQERNPVIGDKFSSRHGQKGVCSQLWPDVDMPFSSVTGMQPDIIINPHAFPSRMTIGMLLESIASKGGAIQGKFMDATPFQNCTYQKSSEVGAVPRQPDGSDNHTNESLVDKFGKILREHGFNYHGTEVMYSGILGTELTCEIFIGIVYYQRLRHMVSDKFQVRSTGAVNPVTQQPVKGRSIGGGIRFGEMERDALLAHGAAYLLHDRMHTCSDYHIANVCSLCGSLFSPVTVSEKQDGHGFGLSLPPIGGRAKKAFCRYCKTGKNIERVAMPFAFRYLAAELAAMNIKLTLKIAKD